MKKLLKLAGLSILFVTLFSACKEPVFYNIMQDVPPEEATVSGAINSIVRYNSNSVEYLVTSSSDGIIYKKADEEGHGKWKKISIPFELAHYNYYGTEWLGEKIIKVAADSQYLYIVTCRFVNDDNTGNNAPYEFIIHSVSADLENNSGTWNVVDTKNQLTYYKDDEGLYHTQFNVFCTNDLENVNRKAYFRGNEANTVYEISGTSSTKKAVTPLDNNSGLIDSAVYFNGYKFFDSMASIATNKSVLWSEGATLRCSTDGTNKVEDYALDAGTEISCLAVTNNAVLIGRGNYKASGTTSSTGGLVKTTFDPTTGKPGTKLTEFTTNAVSQLSSAYLINCILCADPSRDELDASVYAAMIFRGSGSSTSVSYDSIGLWSYYPTRGNWNRE